MTTTSHTIIPGTFAGNGRTQFLVVQNGYWHVAGYTNTGFTVANTGLVPAGEYGAADLDGDGLADLVAQSGGLTPTINVRRNVSAPASTSLAVQFATTAQAAGASVEDIARAVEIAGRRIGECRKPLQTLSENDLAFDVLGAGLKMAGGVPVPLYPPARLTTARPSAISTL